MVQIPVLEKQQTKAWTKSRLNGCSLSSFIGLGLLDLIYHCSVFLECVCKGVRVHAHTCVSSLRGRK